MSIVHFPTEILWIIASSSSGGEISAFARAHRHLYYKLRLALIKHNVKHQNSSALHWAAKTNNRRFAKTLLFHRANINALVDGLSPLMTAAKYDSERVINLLLQKKRLRVNARNSQGESALWLSVAKSTCHTAVVRLLLTHKKTQINAMDIYSDSPLLLAIQEGHRDLVQSLVWQGDRLHINQLNRPDEETALCVAIRHGRLEMLDILLGHPRINVDVINRWGETALLLAVKREDPAMVSRLLGGPNLPCTIALPAEVARSRNNRDMSRLIQEAMKQKSHSDYSSRQR